MRRRDFINGIAGSAATWPIPARAQQPMLPVIGFMHAASPAPYAVFVDAFRQGLKETSYIEKQNVTIEFLWAENDNNRLPALAADLVHREVKLIAAIPILPALAAKAATTTIPIIFEGGADPAAVGLVASLNKPGGNVTGVVNLSVDTLQKQLETIRQILPNATDFGVLLNPKGTGAYDIFKKGAEAAAATLGVKVAILHASNSAEIDVVFQAAVAQRISGLAVSSDPLFISQRDQIIKLAAHAALPVIHALSQYPAQGGLMSYGPSLHDAYRITGVYAGKVLRGEKPADLPVQQITNVELVINLKTAKALGLTMPIPLLGRADHVIE